MVKKWWLRCCLLAITSSCCLSATAQSDSTAVEEEEDYSQYENMTVKDGSRSRAFCNSRILSQTPNRLVSIGYEAGSGFNINSALGTTSHDARVNFTHGLRLEANVPVISRPAMLLNLGMNYIETRMRLEQPAGGSMHPLAQTLQNEGLRNLSFNATLFKPLNEKHFILAQVNADIAGDWRLQHMQPLNATKLSASAIFGWKRSDRRMWGLGLTRTYRAGELNYLPVLLYNYTAPSRKWGLEMLLPARADLRYNLAHQNILRFGFELEGTSYRLNDRRQYFATHPSTTGLINRPLEVRRSDIRIRASWDFTIRNYYWLSLSGGYRHVYNFNIDQGDFYRGFGNKSYFIENQVGGAFFIGLAVSMVSQ